MTQKIDSLRRTIFKSLVCAGAFSSFTSVPSVFAAQSSYTGKLLLNLQLDGAVDVTSFVDPKMNVTGEREINRWARSAEILAAGNIQYAPYAKNQQFFDKHYRNMLIINGVDSQTNSHTVGVVNNWSGRSSIGFPSLTALFASINQPDLPLSYLNFGGFGSTEGIVASTRVKQLAELKNIVLPNNAQWDSSRTFMLQSDVERIQALHAKNMAEMTVSATALEGNLKNRRLYMDAIAKTDEISRFANFIPSEAQLQPERRVDAQTRSTLHQQIQLALLAFKAEVAVAADLFERGFDTHNNHDTTHPLLLANATDAIDYLWTFAEQLGLADRIVLVIGSDFGRTPYFNASEGKDHWPIGSYVVMQKNAAFTNRVYGETDGGHNAKKIHPATLARDDNSGVILRPAHIHKALRKYLRLDNHAIAQRFPFNNIEDFGFFG